MFVSASTTSVHAVIMCQDKQTRQTQQTSRGGCLRLTSDEPGRAAAKPRPASQPVAWPLATGEGYHGRPQGRGSDRPPRVATARSSVAANASGGAAAAQHGGSKIEIKGRRCDGQRKMKTALLTSKSDRMVLSVNGSFFGWYFTCRRSIFPWYFPETVIFQCYQTNFS